MASVSVNFVLILFIIGGSICNDDSYDERHDVSKNVHNLN